MHRLVLALLLLVPSACAAQTAAPAVVRPVFTSTHYAEGNFNELNPGVFASYEGAVVGVAQNSFDETSLAAGYQFSWRPHRYVRLSLSVGIATGYSETGYDIGPSGLVPASMQSVAVGPPDIQVVLIHLPGALIAGLRIPVGGA